MCSVLLPILNSRAQRTKKKKGSDCNHLFFFFRVRLTVEGKKKRTKIEENRCPKLNNNSNKIANKQPVKKTTPERKKKNCCFSFPAIRELMVAGLPRSKAQL